MSADVTAQFEQLAAEWEAHRQARSISSNPNVFFDHPSFTKIVALGEPAVPLIIERYREGTVFWGAALAKITGRTEFGDGVTGDLEATRRGWLDWWDAKNR